jgi:GAF domain-containing protein
VVRWFPRSDKSDVDVESCLANLGRLAAVEASGLIGAPRSDRLDGLTRAAAERLHAPMAFMSVLDDRHAFYASTYDGSNVGLDALLPTAADESYCQFVVATDEPLIVRDSLTDERLRGHPASSGPIRSYLGVPVHSDGHVLGSFCVLDLRPREWTEDEVAELEHLASAALGAASR